MVLPVFLLATLLFLRSADDDAIADRRATSRLRHRQAGDEPLDSKYVLNVDRPTAVHVAPCVRRETLHLDGAANSRTWRRLRHRGSLSDMEQVSKRVAGVDSAVTTHVAPYSLDTPNLERPDVTA